MRLDSKEGPVLAGALTLLQARGWFVWRQNSGVLRNQVGRPVRFGVPGLSDLGALVPGSGRYLAIECKRPGGGKLTPAQEVFLHLVLASGGVALVISDLAVLVQVLDRLTADPFMRLTLEGDPE